MTITQQTAHIDMHGHRIGNMDEPTSDSEAATKGYVDRVANAAKGLSASVTVRSLATKMLVFENGILIRIE